jgi:small-conductance mechanosensitive channel
VNRLRETIGPARLLALAETALAIGLILLGAAVLIRLGVTVIRRTLTPRGERFLDETRLRTLRPLLESLLRYVVYFIALVMILRELGVDATAVLASAGVIGLAVGFGAQHFIRDVIAGFFILAEGLIQVGDVITVGEHTGRVEHISVRTTQIRKYNGELWSIRNGELNVFGNVNRDFSRAIVDVGVAYEADLRRAMAVLQEVGERWAAAHRDLVLAPPEVQGIMAFGESQVTLRLVLTVKPQQHWAAERELRLMLKEAFDRAGIEIPFPRRVTIMRPAPP